MGVASGMFYVLAGGVVLACIVFVIEWVHHRRFKDKTTANKHEVIYRYTIIVFRKCFLGRLERKFMLHSQLQKI